MSNIKLVKSEIRIDGFGSVYYFEHGKEFYHDPEKHNSWEIVYVDKGRIIAVTDGIGSVIEEGYAIFHEPNDVHTHISDRRVSNNMFVVSFISDSPAMDFFKKKTFKLDEISKNLLSLFLAEAKNALGEIQGDYLQRRPLNFGEPQFGSVQLMAAHLEEFLIRLIRNGGEYCNTIKSNEKSRLIAKNSTAKHIADHLRKSVCKNLTLDELCSHFFLGKSQLSLIFKEWSGKSPMQYYSDLKIDEAKKLLRDGELSVGEISERLCYSGIHSFSRAFKSATGFSPTAYKNSIY